MQKSQTIPPFQLHYLHPKYWLLWLGFAVFRLILLLPYPVLQKIGKLLSWLFTQFKFGKKRIAIIEKNLLLAFPSMSQSERYKIIQENIQSVGMAIIETGMAWFWSDKRIKKWSSISGLENLKNYQDKGIILIGVHFLTLELGGRILGIEHPGIGVYRPNNNPLLDWIQLKGRLRSNKHMLQRNDLRGMIKALKNGETVWYAPDHDYGRNNAVFVPFFAVKEAATTTGSYYLTKASPESVIIPFAPLRKKDGSGYHVEVSVPIQLSSNTDKEIIASEINRAIEQEINKGISQYMWLHRRFKTRPHPTDKSLYD